MSIKIMSIIWDRGPENQSERFVLLALADYANDDGECWPSIDGVAKKTCLSDRGVRKIIRRLEDTGWLEVEAGGGRKNCNLYRVKTLNVVQPERGSPLNVVPKNPERGSLNPERGSPEPSRTINKPSLCVPHTQDFQISDFLEVSPRGGNLEATKAAFEELVNAGETPSDIFSAMRAYAEEQDGNNRQYIRYSENFLKDGFWRQYIDAKTVDEMASMEAAAAKIKKHCAKKSGPLEFHPSLAARLIEKKLITATECQKAGIDL